MQRINSLASNAGPPISHVLAIFGSSLRGIAVSSSRLRESLAVLANIHGIIIHPPFIVAR